MDSALKLEVRPVIRSRSPRELLIFNLDDTLVDTSLYWLARTAFARAVAARTGQPEPEIPLTYEAVPKHESVTMRDAWEAFQKECDVPLDTDNDLYLLVAKSLRNKFPAPISGAEDLLKWAQTRFTVALLTSGESEVQMGKLGDSKLGSIFHKIKVVPSKGTADFLSLISEMGFSPRNSWVIGSSIPSDINPGIEAGANCVYYTSPHPTRKGAHAKVEEPSVPVFRIHELSDARAILAKPSASLAA